ncbi:uncharacterized protein BP5553_08024 [Venustampulla echinocandica]|uniref:Siderophore biosynthesis enzyme n=1 Tax=Venustampulla echinocandica TaxID=2656787 RepID=A0A370TFI4_9HELO|nr:uncharacterized protein BP5553_08024 [Venustampulla echinocandica]RDL33656.1 hypothetical protein BP5553_08024 [Venustampulla echinocandica]
MHSSILVVALAALVAAKTDIGGCTSSLTKNEYNQASVLWYVPETGEICEILDCGGGRAPPKTTVPGCGAYSGTATYSPKFLAGFNGASSTQAAPSSQAPAATTSAGDSTPSPSSKDAETPKITTAPTTSGAAGAGTSTLVTSTAPPAQGSGSPVVGGKNETSPTVPGGTAPNSTTSGNPSNIPNAAAGTFVPGALAAIAAAFAFVL